MKSRLNFIIFICFALIVGCAGLKSAGHKYLMSGQILKVMDNKQVYLCIGSKHGATVGQELAVYRNIENSTYKSSEYQSGAPKMLFDRKDVGKITISEIVNEHYSIARVVSGDVKINDIVELNSQQ